MAKRIGLNVAISKSVRDMANKHKSKTGLAIARIVERALLQYLLSERKMDNLTLDAIETELSNDVYRAGLWYERAENAKLIRGNGHHAAQELAAEAVRRLRERAI